MIQRVQTLYILLGIIFLVASLFFPTYLYKAITGEAFVSVFPSKTLTQDEAGLAKGETVWYIVGLFWWAFGVAIASIGMYKSRARQVFLLNASVVIVGILLALMWMQFSSYGHDALSFRTLGYGFYALVLGCFSFLRAAGQVRKDEALVKSMDRLR
jgi:hypothetical protein